MNCFRNTFRHTYTAAFIATMLLWHLAFYMPVATAQSNKASILNSGKNKNIAQRKVDLQAEAKLLRIYQLIGQGQSRQALLESEQLLKLQHLQPDQA